MFAYCPQIPGAVRAIDDSIPPASKSNNPNDWYHCGDMVTTSWNFDGMTFTAPPPESQTAPRAAQLFINSAVAALYESDTVIVRCYAANPPVAVPQAWTDYRAALRAISNQTDTTTKTLPTKPAYPEGT